MMTSNLPQQPTKLQQPSRQPQFSTPDLNRHRQTSLGLPFTPPQRTNSHPDAISVSSTSSLADPDRVLDHFDEFMHRSQQDLTGTQMYFKCLVVVNVTYWKSKSVWSYVIFFQRNDPWFFLVFGSNKRHRRLHVNSFLLGPFLYKNAEAEIDPNVKNTLRTHPRLRTTGESLL